MNTIRKDSTAVQVYNEGLVVFVYDEANSDAIKAAGPNIIEYFSDEPDDALQPLARDGLLVAYELEQDDELAIEVSVGSPLSPEELSRGRWLPVQRARLNAPSGRLRVEGYNNLRLSPDFDPAEDPGAVVDIPPGDYVLSLYRVDWEALEQAGLGEHIDEWGGPWHVIVLSETTEIQPPDSPAPMLRYPMQ